MSRAHQHLTLRQAAVELFDWPDTRSSSLKLRRIIQRKERRLDREIAFRQGEPPSPLYVTMALMKDHMPELFSRRDETLQLVRGELDGIREDHAELKMRVNALAAEHRKLRAECRGSKLQAAL